MSGELRYPANSLIRSENFLQSNILNNIASNTFFPQPIFISINLTGSGYISSPFLEKYTPLLGNELSGTGSLSNPSLSIINNFSSNINGLANISANLTQAKSISITLTGQSNTSAQLIEVLNLNQNISGLSNLDGNFELGIILNPNAISGNGIVYGDLKVNHNFIGDLNGNGLLSQPQLIESIYLNPNSLEGISNLESIPELEVELNGNILGTSNAESNLVQTHNLLGIIEGNSVLNGTISFSGNEKIFYGNITGSSDLSGNSRLFEFSGKLDGIKREKDIDLAVSQNGNLVSGSIFSVATLPNNTDGSRLVFVPFLNKSRSRAVKPPSSNFSVEIYIDNYFDSKLWAKVDFSSTTEIGQIIPMSNWKNLESGERLIFVSNQTFILESFFNDITFGINLAFGVCK